MFNKTLLFYLVRATLRVTVLTSSLPNHQTINAKSPSSIPGPSHDFWPPFGSDSYDHPLRCSLIVSSTSLPLFPLCLSLSSLSFSLCSSLSFSTELSRKKPSLENLTKKQVNWNPISFPPHYSQKGKGEYLYEGKQNTRDISWLAAKV